MNIHFVFPFAQYGWPLIGMLKEKLPDATFDCDWDEVKGFGRYQYKIQLLFKTPFLIYFVIRKCIKRLKQLPLPDYLCVNSDAELIGCLLAQWFMAKPVPIILLGFIYTPRESRLLGEIRRLYYRILLSKTVGVICYSKFESRTLPNFFGLKNTIFQPILFGGNHNLPKDLQLKSKRDSLYLVSAGRSGRDYQLLCNAVKDLPVQLRIICDSNHALKSLVCPSNVSILRHCYGSEYVQEIASSDIVVIPLKDEGTSSGQMVLLDAIALGKLVIITKTATTVEYGEHMKTCYFVEPNSVAAIQSALQQCISQPELISSIGYEAQRYYRKRHSLIPYVTSLAKAIMNVIDGYK